MYWYVIDTINSEIVYSCPDDLSGRENALTAARDHVMEYKTELSASDLLIIRGERHVLTPPSGEWNLVQRDGDY